MDHDPEEVERPPLYADPAFDIVGLDGAMTLFRYHLEEKRPALRMLYAATVEGGRAQWEYACTPVGDADEFELSERLRAAMQAADSAAGAFFIVADTLFESLSSSLHVIRTGKRRNGRDFSGPRVADLLHAAGNFVRHSAEWGALARDTRDISQLSNAGKRAVEILASVLGAANGAVVEVVLGSSWRMFAVLHAISGERTNVTQHPTFQNYDLFEALLEREARAMIERCREAQAADQGPEHD